MNNTSPQHFNQGFHQNGQPANAQAMYNQANQMMNQGVNPMSTSNPVGNMNMNPNLMQAQLNHNPNAQNYGQMISGNNSNPHNPNSNSVNVSGKLTEPNINVNMVGNNNENIINPNVNMQHLSPDNIHLNVNENDHHKKKKGSPKNNVL